MNNLSCVNSAQYIWFIMKNILKNTFVLTSVASAVLLQMNAYAAAIKQHALLPASAVSMAAIDIETIQVKGQINSLILSSEIDLTASSSPDLRKQISLLPSVDINSNGMVTGIIQYRGMYSDRLKISIDDTMIAGAGPNAMDSPLSHVIGNYGQTVTLYNGIAPVSAGAETIGGAIDISDVKPLLTNSENFSYSGMTSVGWFNNNSESLNASAQATNKHTYFAISADYQKGDNYTSGNGIEMPSTFYDRYGIKLRAGYQKDKHTLDFSVVVRNTGESGTPTLAMDIIFVDALVSSIDYSYEVNDDWTLSAKLFGNNNYHDMNNFQLRPNPNIMGHRLNSVDSQGRGLDVSMKKDDQYWQAEIGMNATNRKHNSYITNPNNAMFFIDNFNNVERSLTSIFAEIQRNSLTKKELSIKDWQLGIRYSQVHADADNVGSNIAMMNPNVRALRDAFNNGESQQNFSLLDAVAKVSMNISPLVDLQLSAGIKENAPSYQQLYSWFPLGVSAGLADGRNYIGNVNLNKETATKLDVSALIEGENWVLIPNAYFSKIDDYIIGMPSANSSANMIAMMMGAQVPLVWSNQDAEIAGFDLSYKHRLSENLDITAVGQYVRGKQTGEVEQNLYRLAPFTATISINYEMDALALQITSKLVSAQNKVADLQNETATAGYGLLDLQASYEFENGLKATLIAENILDKNYANHLSGVNRVNGAELPVGSKVLGTGRNIGMHLTYFF